MTSYILRKEVLHRLLLAKSILSPALSVSWEQPNDHVTARQVLNAHDAADLIFAAVADQLGKLPVRSHAPSMLQCLELIDMPGEKHQGYFKQLNDARDGLKHVGNLPNARQWSGVAQDCFDKLADICQTTLGISLRDMDESELLLNDLVKKYLSSARKARESGDFRSALEEIGKALFVVFDASHQTINVGRAKAEDALKLTAFGVSAKDFLKLQEFLPCVDGLTADSLTVAWKQSKFGHPGNWNEATVSFCLAAGLNVAICVQNAPATPHAFEFDHLYQYKITAQTDNVGVWEDLIDGHLEQVQPLRSRNFKRHLKRGQSIIIRGRTSCFVSEDISPEKHEVIKRIRVSEPSLLLALFGEDNKADFVDLADVRITCIPTDLAKELLPDLPEIPWQEDPE